MPKTRRQKKAEKSLCNVFLVGLEESGAVAVPFEVPNNQGWKMSRRVG